MDARERMAFKEVQDCGLGGRADNQWFERTVERLQVAARAFTASVEEAGNPRASCEAALLAMSMKERDKVTSTIDLLRDALSKTPIGTQITEERGSVGSSVVDAGDHGDAPLPPQGIVEDSPALNGEVSRGYSTASSTSSSGLEQLPPSIPRATSSSPATLPRSNSGKSLDGVQRSNGEGGSLPGRGR